MRLPALGSAVALSWLLVLAAGCDEKGAPLGDNSLRTQLNENWDLWLASAEGEYTFDFHWQCFCLAELTEDVLVEVAEYEVWQVTYLEDGAPVDESLLPHFPVIPQLFLLIEHAIDDDADVILVEFDEERGYPTSALLDYDAQTVDDELAFQVWNVVVGTTAARAVRRD